MSENKSRRDFLKMAAIGTVAASTTNINYISANHANKPNIVLIVSDDHGLDALGCYGNNVVKTPNIDSLAKDGVRFTNAFCTSASCSPSRSVILTGLHNHANGQYGLQHDFHHFQTFDHIKSLPYFLANAGYRTARIGKFHIAPTSVYPFEKVLSHGKANDPTSIGRSPVLMAEQCTDFISDKDARPFFLYFAVDDPHREEPFYTGDKPNAFGNRPEGYPGVKPITYDPKDVIVPSFLPDSPECRAELAQYYQSIARMDQGIGKLIEILKKYNCYDNTVIIYISDNGIAFTGAKTTHYEPGIHLPCIVKPTSSNKKGLVNNAMISWTDITPTILDFADALPQEHHFHGKSFKAILQTENPNNWDEVYCSHTFHESTMYYPMRTVRTKKYKLIHNLAHQLQFPFAQDLSASPTYIAALKDPKQIYGKRQISKFLHRPEYELYDLENDPDEINNLADNKNYETILNELKNKIHKFQEDTMDPWISDESAPQRWKTYKWPK